MATFSPDVAWRISKRHDLMVGQWLAGTGLDGANVDTFLIQIKNHLDANYASFRDPALNDYPVNLVRRAYLTIRTAGK